MRADSMHKKSVPLAQQDIYLHTTKLCPRVQDFRSRMFILIQMYFSIRPLRTVVVYIVRRYRIQSQFTQFPSCVFCIIGRVS